MMNVDSINSMQYGGPENNRLRKAEQEAAGKVSGAAHSSVHASFASILDKSIHYSPDTSSVIQEARRALEAGELDSAEAIRDAAGKIIRQGI